MKKFSLDTLKQITVKLLSNKKMLLLIMGPAKLLLLGCSLYAFSGRYISTDNAYTKADIAIISSEISGKIASINITNNHPVIKNDILFTIDQEPYIIALNHAHAKLLNARTQVESLHANYNQMLAELDREKEALRFAEVEYLRYKLLAENKAVPVAQSDAAEHNYKAAIKEFEITQQKTSSAKAMLAGNDNSTIEEHPIYQEAFNEYEKAKLDLIHTKVYAPIEGTVANFDLQMGEFVSTGSPLFSIVNTKHFWIEANYKETDLTYIRPNQKAIVTIDAYPDKQWKATVASITPASGAEFSILPPQNSSGNWVKVVQRVMVKLEFDDYDPTSLLVAGMSANVTIDTKHSRISRFFTAK